MKTASQSFEHDAASVRFIEKIHYQLLKALHHQFFTFDAGLAPMYEKICQWIDQRGRRKRMLHLLENASKKVMLNCQQCGDCGIQHLAFLCPESQCPKHTRNGACGGSREGRCEVRPEKNCVWGRVYHRLAAFEKREKMMSECVPPRMWELNQSSSWLNFHLKRDH
jgi:methylenetetrahydrofolate reductase (NADPH)